MKNILFVTASLGFGGAAKMLTFVATELSKRGHKVGIVNLDCLDWKTDFQQAVSNDVTVYKLEKRHKNKNVNAIKELRRIAKEFKADVLVSFTTFPNMYAKIVGTMLGIPSIMSERGDPERTKGNNIKSKISTWIINRSKGGVFQTEGAKEFYGKGLQKRGVVIPNPIFIKDDVPDINYEKREKSIVSVGRLDNAQKRYDVMLKAFKLFSDKHPEYSLKLYGEGADKQQIIEWCKELGLLDKVKFMGLTRTPMQDMAKCEASIITSDFEGISNSLLEAMAVGLPCVSTDHTPGGARLLIKHGENGLLAPMGDEKRLAECLCGFVEDKTLAKSCGEKAKEVLTRFAPNKIIDKWEKYFIKITEKK